MARSASEELGPPPGADHSLGYEEVQASAEFGELRRRFRAFVFPATAFFLVWYFLYVILAAYVPAFMSTKLFGNINVGLVFGLLQFVTTFGITIAYVRWADREFDPRADAIRARMEGAATTSTTATTATTATTSEVREDRA